MGRAVRQILSHCKREDWRRKRLLIAKKREHIDKAQGVTYSLKEGKLPFYVSPRCENDRPLDCRFSELTYAESTTLSPNSYGPIGFSCSGVRCVPSQEETPQCARGLWKGTGRLRRVPLHQEFDETSE